MAAKSASLKRTLFLLSLCLLFALPVCARDLSYRYRDSLLRVAFLYNLAKFVSWPSEGPDRQKAPLILTILDPSMDDDALASIDGRLVRGRPLRIKDIADIGELGETDLLYLGASRKSDLEAVRDALKGRPVLSISNIQGFAGNSGVVELYRDGRSIRFGINLQAARRAGLTVSSEVLRLASFVIEAGEEETRE